jgi:sulfopyruvate decarboxylase TPP-binding subunit
MLTGPQIVAELEHLGITHVVWLPDSTLGTWDAALTQSDTIRLIRVCREGEAWAIAHGLHLGGARPIVVIQCTGLFDSGDSLRCALYDYGIPLFAIIGYRSYLIPTATDSAKTYTEPMLNAFKVPYRLIDSADKLPLLAEHYTACRNANKPGVVLLAEGKM